MTDNQTGMTEGLWLDLAEHCVKQGLQPCFTIMVTDQTGISVPAVFDPGDGSGGTMPLEIAVPVDEHGKPIEPVLVFPLKVEADDHTGKTCSFTVSRSTELGVTFSPSHTQPNSSQPHLRFASRTSLKRARSPWAHDR